MPIIIAALGLLATVYVYYRRSQGIARTAADVVDVIDGARLGVRRFRFQRKANTHPAEAIDDPLIAVGGIAAAFVELDPMPTKDSWDRLTLNLAREFRLSAEEAQELSVLGRWFVTQCGTPPAAITRLSKKLYRLNGTQDALTLLAVIQHTLVPAGERLSDQQREALYDLKRIVRI
ncbi:MAG: hypothetical protein AAF748_02490 [Pseudomonadota bacterium]